MNSRHSRFALVLGLVPTFLLAGGAGCTPVRALRERVWPKAAETPTPAPAEPTPARARYFPEYVMESFPGLEDVGIDIRSPRISIAAEKVLTTDEPQRRRGPPHFSPDGRLLAYEEREGDARWLVIRKLDGTRVRRILLSRESADRERQVRRTAAGWNARVLAWAPSSDAFAYTRETPLGAYEAVTADLAGDASPLEGPPALDGSVAWSPAGDRIAYIPATRIGEIWSAEVSTRIAEPLAIVDAPVASFSFSPDGRRLVFTAGRASGRNIRVLDFDLEHPSPRLESGTGKLLRITRWPFDDLRPAFSPDGGRIAFFSSFRPAGAEAGLSLLVVDSRGGDASSGAVLMSRVLAPTTSPRSSSPPAWSPDSKWIAFIEPRTSDYHAIVRVDAATGEHYEMAPDSLTNEDITVSADGVLAYRTRQGWGDHIVIALTAHGVTRKE